MIHKKESAMTRLFPVRCCVAVALLAIGGCAAPIPDYSPNYTYVPVPSPRRPHRVAYVVVPEACLTPDPTAAEPLGPMLPPGCANAYNLQRMTEREGDVMRGRKLGRAPAAPTVRAAQKYLNGDEEPLGAGVGKPGSPGAPQQETAQPPAPTPAAVSRK
jgi:hypothetical protein